ncbi:AsnC family transcriptional regulator [Pokkaliibacter plantistimulans]|uniref:AsnC family transcriptional regulator n=2 Tax=Pseudomonadota TaxID=1224 RepID=A0ABX5M5F7_9GAMM|nr:Lrp/AsnC family transcriptional regulator [Pokkaliibacter plantistimulans]PPC78176.1 Lrp/AsnC family transcriptional regulator [Pokkaliibacter plantistimulans]PXF32963.1 AsnC family transcriptional regulator [Pokkaliibacter plantistimulans]
MNDNAIDELDRQILQRVQQDCLLKSEVIAAEIGLSASAVQRRLKRLRQQGVIRAEVAVLDNRQLDRLMTFIAGLEIERENYSAMDRLRRWADQQPAIQQLYYVTGAVDLVAIILARDVEEYDHLTAEIMANNPEIRRITTNVVLNSLKTGSQLPIAGLAGEKAG